MNDYLNTVRERNSNTQILQRTHFISTNLIIIIIDSRKVCMEERSASSFIQFFCLPSLVQYTPLLKQLQAVEREREKLEVFTVYITPRLLLMELTDHGNTRTTSMYVTELIDYALDCYHLGQLLWQNLGVLNQALNFV